LSSKSVFNGLNFTGLKFTSPQPTKVLEKSKIHFEIGTKARRKEGLQGDDHKAENDCLQPAPLLSTYLLFEVNYWGTAGINGSVSRS